MKYVLIAPLFLTIIITTMLLSLNKRSIDNEFPLESGNYNGLWNSKTTHRTFTDLPISARIEEVSSGQFKGSFFITSNFTSCCNSGENDGTITFKVNKNVLNEFVYIDIIPKCNGSFTGKGKILDNNLVLIHIQGTDCDGDHKGTITLSKE